MEARCHCDGAEDGATEKELEDNRTSQTSEEAGVTFQGCPGDLEMRQSKRMNCRVTYWAQLACDMGSDRDQGDGSRAP